MECARNVGPLGPEEWVRSLKGFAALRGVTAATVAWHYRTLIYVHNMRWNTCSETAAWQLVMDLSYLYKTGSWAPTGGSRGFCLLSACSDIPSFGQGLIRTTELPNRTLHQVYLVIAVRAFGLMW